MGQRVFSRLLLVGLLLLNTSCHDVLDAFLYDWGDDCWDWDSCDYGSNHSSNGDYTTTRVVWRCPDTDSSVSGNFTSSFTNLTITDQDGSEVFDNSIATYAWFVVGPDLDWKTQGVNLDVYEYYFFSLASGELLILRFVNDMPEDGGNAISSGTYYLIAADHGVSQESLQSYLADQDVSHTVRAALDVEAVFSDVVSTGDFTGAIVDFGSGAFAYDMSVAFVAEDGRTVSYDVFFNVQAQAESAAVTFQNAYGREAYTVYGDSSASSYTYTINVSNENVLTNSGRADVADFDDYCGPGPSLQDPVVFGVE